MMSRKSVVKAAAVTLTASALLIGGQAGRADAKMPKMDNKFLVEATEYVLQKQEVLKSMSDEVTAQARKGGDTVQGGYDVEPEQVIVWWIEDGKAVSIVNVKARSSKQQKTYKFAFLFKDDGYHIVFLYPGTSNTDPLLFADVLPAAEREAQVHLNSDEVTIMDTRVTGEIDASGWDEAWLWANAKGKTYRMNIMFTTSPGGGTVWSIKGS